jgi:potassium-dependent mechanosensitive channel
MAKMSNRMVQVLAWCAILLLPKVAAAQGGLLQQEPPGAADTVQAEVAPVLGPSAIATGVRVVEDSATIALRQIASLGDVEGILAVLEEARTRQQELNGLLEALGAVEHTRPERLFRLRDLALTNAQRIEQQSERVTERLGELTDLRSEWLARLSTLSGWRSEAAARPDLAPQRSEVARALGLAEQVIARVEETYPVLTAAGEEAQLTLAETRQMLDRVAALRAGRREALLQRDQPFLFSPAHLAQLTEPSEWVPAEAFDPRALAAFGREHAGLLILHLGLIIVFWTVARRLRLYTVPEGGWAGLLHHPWAFATFAATAFLHRRYILAPPIWDVVNWGLLTGSGAILAWMLLRGWALRVMVSAVAAVYPLLLLGEALRLPASVFRLGIAGAAAAAVIGFPLLALRADGTTPAGRRSRAVLGVATLLSAAVLVAQLLGLDQLSRWLVHATLTSAYVVFAIAFLIVLGRGVLRTLLRSEHIGRIRLISLVAVPLAERLLRVLQLVLVIGGALVILDVWELAPSPSETWSNLVNWGFVFAGVRITVGRLLLAGVLIYLAYTVSWLMRTLVQVEVSRGWNLERGVAESINTLVHYAVITLGVLFGLGALGVELQNFAIVAGALGVGIGFGLQTVVNNFVSGLILLFERPVRVGDTVEVDGEWGTIKKIGLRSTVVVTFTQAELIVPNADLVSQKVTNWTLTNPVTRLGLPVGVAYGSDITRVLQILVEAGSLHPAVAKDPPPSALFIGFGDSSLDFELRIWITDIASRLIAKSAILAEIDARFRAEGIEIPFPQRDLHIRSVDPAVARSVLSPAVREGDLDG